MTVTPYRAVSAMLLLGFVAPLTPAADYSSSSAATEIKVVMQTFMVAWSRQASERELSDLLYDTSDQFALIGEGLDHPVQDVPSLMREFTKLRTEWRTGCTFTLRGPVKRSGSLAATLNTLGCPAIPSATAFDYYILLVWKHTPRGWRVVMESYSTYQAAR